MHQKNLKDNKKRYSEIELLRCVGCFLVICAHMYPTIIENGNIYKGRLLIGAIIGDDVPVFLLITGFFLFQKGDISIITYWKSKLCSFLKKIWIPSIFLVIITCVLTPIIEKANTLSDVGGWNQLNGMIYIVFF